MCEGELSWNAALTSSAFVQPRPSGEADIPNDKEEKKNNNAVTAFLPASHNGTFVGASVARALFEEAAAETHMLRSN